MMNFKKSGHDALWGSESWEISAHLSDPSVIDNEEFRFFNPQKENKK